MFDNITIQEKDAKQRLTFFNSFIIGRRLKQEIESGNATAQNYTFLAVACATHKDMKNALKYALKAIFIDRTYAYAYFVAGELYLMRDKNYDRARKYFLKAFKYGGNNYYLAVYELIRMYANDGDNVERYKYEEILLNSDSDNVGFHIRKTHVYVGWNDFPSAWKNFVETYKLSRKQKTPFADIEDLFAEVVALGIANIFVKNFFKIDLGEYWFKVGRNEDAIKLLLSVMKQGSKWTKHLAGKALIEHYWDVDEFKQCVEVANRMLIAEKTSYAYYHKAICLYELDKYDAALKYLDLAQEIDKRGEFNNYDYWRAICHAAKYDLHMALKSINYALLIKKNASNFSIKGQILREMNRYDEANVCFKEAERMRELESS